MSLVPTLGILALSVLMAPLVAQAAAANGGGEEMVPVRAMVVDAAGRPIAAVRPLK